MADPTPFKYGHVQYPLPSTSITDSLLQTCDPVVATLLNFFAYRITTYIGEAIVNTADLNKVPIEAPVETKIPIDPIVIAKADQFKFPLLAVWRKRSVFSDHSINWRQNVCTFGVVYILPTMTAAQSIRMWPVLNSVSDVIDHSIKVGTDPGFNSGARVFADTEVGRARLMNGAFIPEPFGDTMVFQAWSGEIEITEVMRPSTVGLPALTGTGVSITDESVQEGNPIEMTNFRTDV